MFDIFGSSSTAGRPFKAYYVYILKSEQGNHHYVGRTADLQACLQTHNQGGCSHTAMFRPWHIETAVAFWNEEKAIAFELYLKSGSGREFSRRHF
ncbi:MAG: GIY-YIG nuclease family protein [Kiritimatiellales bacterium]|nr:GIY-YIG nuclease family protein [Kiritimatiellales bacterium]